MYIMILSDNGLAFEEVTDINSAEAIANNSTWAEISIEEINTIIDLAQSFKAKVLMPDEIHESEVDNLLATTFKVEPYRSASDLF